MISRVLRLGFAFGLACVLLPLPSVRAQATAAQAPAVPPKPADAALPAGQTIIDRHLEASGGRKALEAVNSVNIKGSITIPANGMTGTIEVSTARPNKARLKTNLAGIGEILEGFDGTTAWSMSPMTGPMLATGAELEQKIFDSDFDRGMGIAHKYESIRTTEKTTFEGRPVYRVELTKKGGPTDVEFYDVETGLKAGGVIERTNPMGTISATSAVSEYKKFGDLLHPTVLKHTVSGVQIITTFTSIEFNTVEPAVFELPAAIKALIK
jgi:hypothetical protein